MKSRRVGRRLHMRHDRCPADQEVEIAAVLSLGDVLRIHLAVTANKSSIHSRLNKIRSTAVQLGRIDVKV